VSGYELEDRVIEVRSPVAVSRLALGPTQPSVGTGGPFPGGKARPGSNADHLPPSSAVMNE
jgi:hypothetical protein